MRAKRKNEGKTIADPSATCPSANLQAPPFPGPEVWSAWQAPADFHPGETCRFSSPGKVGFWPSLLSVVALCGQFANIWLPGVDSLKETEEVTHNVKNQLCHPQIS